jgi:hypothetical protein
MWESLPQSYARGNRRYWDEYDGNGRVGQQLAALSIISAHLVSESASVLRSSNCGTSEGDSGVCISNGEMGLLDQKMSNITWGTRLARLLSRF